MIKHHALVSGGEGEVGDGRCGYTNGVGRFREWREIYVVALVPQPLEEILLLVIEEEVLIETTDINEGILAEQDARSYEHLASPHPAMGIELPELAGEKRFTQQLLEGFGYQTS